MNILILPFLLLAFSNLHATKSIYTLHATHIQLMCRQYWKKAYILWGKSSRRDRKWCFTRIKQNRASHFSLRFCSAGYPVGAKRRTIWGQSRRVDKIHLLLLDTNCIWILQTSMYMHVLLCTWNLRDLWHSGKPSGSIEWFLRKPWNHTSYRNHKPQEFLGMQICNYIGFFLVRIPKHNLHP